MGNSSCGRSSCSSSIVASEKKAQRSGGCVGTFFQLFDWNRRLPKKKFFSKKVLPLARAKRALKNFGRDEKYPMPKNLLNDDEMKAPGLVAWLTGLEFEAGVGRDSESGSGYGLGVSNDQVPKGQAKMDSRPLKFQRTGLFKRKPVSRFGAEALRKSLLSRSRKHQTKLSSPVKSPRVGRNTARLMEATNRAKCALTYGPSLHRPPRDVVMTECPVFLTPDQSKRPCFPADSSSSNLHYDRDSFAPSLNRIKDLELEQNLAGCTWPRMTCKQLDKGKFKVEKNLLNRSGDSSLRARMPTRKKRPVGNKLDVEGSGLGSSTLRKQRETGGNEIFGNIAGHRAPFMNKNGSVTSVNATSGVSETIVSPSMHDLQVYGIVVSFLLCFVVFGGVKLINRVAPAFLLPVIFSLLCIFLRIFISKKGYPSTGITGLSATTFKDNWSSGYQRTNNAGVPDPVGEIYWNFNWLVGLFFPAVTGIMAGSNRSASLKDTLRSIPIGTLAATLSTTTLYLVPVLLFGAFATREKLLKDRLLTATVAWPVPAIIYVGIILSTLGAALQSLTGALRLLAAMANDDILPILKYFRVAEGNEPHIATLFTAFICIACVVIGNLDPVTPTITMFFLLCYAGVNLSCSLLDLLDASSWCPRWKFHHWSLSLLGASLCFVIINAVIM